MKTGGMDIVYILGKGSMWRNNELRYSLRSLKNLPHRRVYIVGYLPKFIRTDRVIHIPAEDPTSSKLLNSLHKHRIACDTKEISEDFILMNDDFYVMKPVDEIPRWHKDTIEKTLTEHPTKAGYYYQALVLTEAFLKSNGVKKPLDYSVHYPVVFNKEKLSKVLDFCQKLSPNGLLIRTIYGNEYWRKTEQHKDVKVSHERNLEEMEKEPFVSITDNLTLKTGFRFWIDRKFPVASQYEIETIQDNMEPETQTYSAPKGVDIDGVYYGPGTIIKNRKLSPEIVLANGLVLCE